MIYKQKLTKIGNSVGFTLPKPLREKLNFKLGEEVYLEQDPQKKVLVVALKPMDKSVKVVDPEFYNLVKRVSRKYSIALKKLAKS